jgi:predicted dehydrogenase
MTKQRIGVAGIGMISGIYLQNLTCMFGEQVIITGVSDVIPERAEQAAAKYKIKCFKDTTELIASPEVDIVVNLTQPQYHYQIALEAVKAGKHIYNEKPLCAQRKEALEILKIAASNNVLVGGAPDTFLGTGIQTCRKCIDDGMIGKPVAAAAFLMNHGHEHWYPNPLFYYKKGGGPMFDMGGYYLTAMVNILGPVARVCGSTVMGLKQRTVTSEPLKGTVIDVEVPTHITAVMDFASGASATFITSFEVHSHTLPCMEIYGTEGSLRVPDPNTFGGPVFIRLAGEETWKEIPLLDTYPENSRGLGIADMAEAIADSRPHRANGELAYHILDVMHGIYDASSSGKYYDVKSGCPRPEPLVLRI